MPGPGQSHEHPPARQWCTLTPTIVLTALATLIVLLRLFTRCRIVHAVGYDDLVILISLVLSWTVCGLTVAEVNAGIGAYVWSSNLDLRPYNAKLVIAWNCVYVCLINVTKASILMQYLRVFSTRTMRALTFALLACLVPALLWGILGGVLLCRPVDKLWHLAIPGHCASLRTYWLSSAGLNIVLDFATVLLPLPAIWGLRLPMRQKVVLVAVFLIGLFVCGVSLARVALVHEATLRKDWTDASVNAFTWSTVEANTGIICASVLALKPLFVVLFPKFMREPGTARHSYRLPTIKDTTTSSSSHKDVEKKAGTRELSVSSYGGETLMPFPSVAQTLARTDTRMTLGRAVTATELRRGSTWNSNNPGEGMDFWEALRLGRNTVQEDEINEANDHVN